jgi:hypothetical protein
VKVKYIFEYEVEGVTILEDWCLLNHPTEVAFYLYETSSLSITTDAYICSDYRGTESGPKKSAIGRTIYPSSALAALPYSRHFGTSITFPFLGIYSPGSLRSTPLDKLKRGRGRVNNQ